MGRLKQKRPISPKKKARTKSDREKEQQPVVASPGEVPESDRMESEEKKPAAPNKTATPEREAPKPVKPSGRKPELTFWTNAVQFLREVKIELKKVTWPSKKDTMASTVVVIILVMIVSAFLGLVDVGLSSLIGLVLR